MGKLILFAGSPGARGRAVLRGKEPGWSGPLGRTIRIDELTLSRAPKDGSSRSIAVTASNLSARSLRNFRRRDALRALEAPTSAVTSTGWVER